jgi:4-aminobutyrate aminotransferase
MRPAHRRPRIKRWTQARRICIDVTSRAWSPSSFSGLQVSSIAGGNRYRGPYHGMSDGQLIDRCTADLREVIETTTAGDVACFIAEPIQGVGGMIVPPDGLFAAIAGVLRDYDIPFISDEIQAGWGVPAMGSGDIRHTTWSRTR